MIIKGNQFTETVIIEIRSNPTEERNDLTTYFHNVINIKRFNTDLHSHIGNAIEYHTTQM